MNLHIMRALAEIANVLDGIGRLDFSEHGWRNEMTDAEIQGVLYFKSCPAIYVRNTLDSTRLEGFVREKFPCLSSADVKGVSDHVSDLFYRYAKELSEDGGSVIFLHEILEYAWQAADFLRERIRAAGHTV